MLNNRLAAILEIYLRRGNGDVPLQLQALKARKAAQCWSQHAWHRATLAGLMQLHQTHFILRKFSRAARAAKLRGARSCFCVDVRPSVLRSTAEVCAVCECVFHAVVSHVEVLVVIVVHVGVVDWCGHCGGRRSCRGGRR